MLAIKPGWFCTCKRVLMSHNGLVMAAVALEAKPGVVLSLSYTMHIYCQ